MVRRTRVVRASEEFVNLKNIITRETGKEFSDAEFSRELSNFLVEEDILPIIVRRTKMNKNRRRGWFT